MKVMKESARSKKYIVYDINCFSSPRRRLPQYSTMLWKAWSIYIPDGRSTGISKQGTFCWTQRAMPNWPTSGWQDSLRSVLLRVVVLVHKQCILPWPLINKVLFCCLDFQSKSTLKDSFLMYKMIIIGWKQKKMFLS